MDEEDATENVTRKEKEVKSKSKRGENIKGSSMGTQVSKDISDVDSTAHVRAAGKDGIAEMKKYLKKNKAKKIKKSKEAESGIKRGSEQGELTVSYGEDRSGDPMDKVERKLKETQKDKTSNTKEVEENEESISKTKNIKDASKERKKKHKVKRKLENVDFEKEGEIDAGQHIQNSERKKRKMEKTNCKDDSSFLQQEKMPNIVEENIGLTEHDGNYVKELERKNKNKNKNKKKKHTQLIESGSDDLLDNGVECDEKGKFKKTKPVKNSTDDASPNKSKKKVRFSDQDEVFSIPDNSNSVTENVGADGLIRGNRFSPDEDETVKAAVLHYIEKNDLGDEGLDMVLNCRKYPKVRGCWKEIHTAIPYRPRRAVYCRAHSLFLRSEARKWTQEEYDLLRSYQKEHGNKWKAIAAELGKYSNSVAVAWWSRIKGNYNRGHWSQDEYQKLFNLVNLDLQAKLSEEKIAKHGMLRDNISWTAISEKLSTRSNARCCDKWYLQLTSRMVADGVWADKDDYRLIEALYGLDATCVEDVDWDVLLDNRERDLCRKRWNQMVLHIGQHGNKSFSGQVEVLAQRYCPILLEAREAWDSKPRVG